jgi:hypothetical protein
MDALAAAHARCFALTFVRSKAGTRPTLCPSCAAEAAVLVYLRTRNMLLGG